MDNIQMISPDTDFSGYNLAAILADVIMHRRSTRRFRTEAVSPEDIDDILKAGIYAPSGSNAQNQRFLVVTDPEEIARIGCKRFVWPYAVKDIERLKKRFPSGILGFAPALIFVFIDSMGTDPLNRGEYHVWETLEPQNAGAAIQNMLLMATAKGLASCWVSATESMSYSRLLSGNNWRQIFAQYDLPPSYKIQGCVLLGHPKTKDKQGYATGEKKHGVLYRTTDRQPVQHYLVRKKLPLTASAKVDLAGKKKLITLNILRQIMLLLSVLMKRIDRLIYRIEHTS